MVLCQVRINNEQIKFHNTAWHLDGSISCGTVHVNYTVQDSSV